MITFRRQLTKLQVLQDGNTLDNELEVVEGMKLNRGYLSPYFVTDQKTQKCVSYALYLFFFGYAIAISHLICSFNNC